MMGRKKKARVLKKIAGTIRPCRDNPNQPTPDPGLPMAPEWLPRRAAEIFCGLAVKLEMQQLASKSHAEMLAYWSLRQYEVELYTRILEREGRTYETVNEAGGIMHRPRPEVGMLADATRHAQSLAAEFGGSPAATQKVSRMGTVTPTTQNTFAKLHADWGGKL